MFPALVLCNRHVFISTLFQFILLSQQALKEISLINKIKRVWQTPGVQYNTYLGTGPCSDKASFKIYQHALPSNLISTSQQMSKLV